MSAFFEQVDKIKPVFDITYKIVLFVCKLLLIADILITTMSVIGRYVSFIPDPAWSEEVVLTCMAYMAVLSNPARGAYPNDSARPFSAARSASVFGHFGRRLRLDFGSCDDCCRLEICVGTWRKRKLCQHAVAFKILDVFSGACSRYRDADF